MALPVTKVEIAFDSGFSTPEGDRTWTDVSAYVEGDQGIDITYGRADELAAPDPNSLRVTFDNRDGRFTPDKSSSPYYPNVAKGKPIRVTVTYNSVDYYVRFTGYVDSWPLVWPDGSSSASTVTISASSRRARLGQTAALGYSPLRYAYVIPEWPQAYWPMDYTRITRDGREVFIDETNIGTPIGLNAGRLGVFTTTAALQPTFDGTPGPIDESGMLKFPRYTDAALLDDRAHYVGAGRCCNIGTTGEFTFEMVVRFDAPADEVCLTTPFELLSTNGNEWIVLNIGNGGALELGYLRLSLILFEEGVAVVNTANVGYDFEDYAALIDGELHHLALTLTGGDTASLYVDGALFTTVTLTGGNTYAEPFTAVAVGTETYGGALWAGHVAVRDAALSAPEIAAHAAGATTADESIEERLQRLAGYIGVPATEVEAEDSVVIDVGDQTQKGRSPIAVADELATSTGGVLYDTREGHLFMQARNHRYNQTSAFTLSATTQEVAGDLEAVLDDRYLINDISVTRTGVDDLDFTHSSPTSVAAYGTYHHAIEMVTTTWEEGRSTADYVIQRYSTPEVRISTVTVDLANLSTSQRALVLAADIGTLFNIASLPAQAPADPMPLYLEGYTETITPTGHTISMNTTPGGYFTNVAVLNDASHNVLDSGITLAH